MGYELRSSHLFPQNLEAIVRFCAEMRMKVVLMYRALFHALYFSSAVQRPTPSRFQPLSSRPDGEALSFQY